MNLNDARQLRQELEAIEATMKRIRKLWLTREFPSAKELKDQQDRVESIEFTMNSIIQKADRLPTADDVVDLDSAVSRTLERTENIIGKTKKLAKDV